MTGDRHSLYDLAIVGLGPVGAVTAILAAMRGMRVCVLERDADIYRLPRAAHFDHEIMRIFQACGVAEQVLPHTRPVPAYDFRNAKGESLLYFPAPPPNARSGWEQGYMFFQPGLEGVLRARMTDFADIGIRLRHTVQSLDQGPDAVTLGATGPAGEETIKARYVVGADGAASTVRRLAGLELDDLQFDEPWLVVDAEVRDPQGLPATNLQICDPARPTTCVLMGPGRHRWEFMLLPGETAEEIASDSSIARLLAPWVRPGQVEIVRRAVYRFHGLIARRWRQGRVFLAGDSAHQMPPFLGQGLCSGIRDAFNLIWKLDMARRGLGAERLLETYQSEREPHVRAIVGIAMVMGRVVCTLDPEAAAARDKEMLAGRAAGKQAEALDLPGITQGMTGEPVPGITGEAIPQFARDGRERFDAALGLEFALLCPTAAARDGLAARVRPADRVIVLGPDAAPGLAAWLDGRTALVRPDRVVFGLGEPETLLAALRGWLA
jgi:3-(3-hydroxy-phenyl)propionate hydroxylase